MRRSSFERLSLVLTLIGLVGAPAAALAQDEAGPRPRELRPVERGGFLEADFGLAYLVGDIDGRSYGVAPMLGVFAGYDIAPVFNLSVGVLAGAFGITEDADAPAPRVDLFFIAPVLRAQVAVVTTERDFLWIRAEGGASFGLPREIDGVPYGGIGPIFGGGIGYERFTKLRHFSLGVQLGALAVTKPELAVAVTLLPTLKYTF